ncbi:hypothetical protein CJF42_11515 [Pseudoalteromonas sp. NBT06-2]|nr:hypothetical protein CJF42_11515 [Pseudoalteromonas sp. NBT06-2]
MLLVVYNVDVNLKLEKRLLFQHCGHYDCGVKGKPQMFAKAFVPRHVKFPLRCVNLDRYTQAT